MSDVDLTVVVTARDETVVCGPTMQSADVAVAEARDRGYTVETIVALDKATGATHEYFHQPRFDHWDRWEMHEGDLGRVRNAIVPQTKGRYIAFLDADDLFSQNWLAEGIAALDAVAERGERAIAHPELNVCFDGSKSVRQNVDSTSPLFTPYMLYVRNCYDSLCMSPREAHMAVPYGHRDIQNGLSYQDWQFAIQTLSRGWRHLVVQDTIIFKRRRDFSLVVESNNRKSIVRSLPEMAIDRVRDLTSGDQTTTSTWTDRQLGEIPRADTEPELRQPVATEKVEDRPLTRETSDQQAWEIDEEARRIIGAVTPRTMTGTTKLFGMIEALRYIDRVGIPGEIVECGVWRGGSMQAAALTLLGCHDTERELHLFDTFEGMPPPSDVDVRFKDGQTADEIMRTSDKDTRIWAIADLDDVKQGMAETGYPSEKIFYHEGRVEETIPDEAPNRIALLRLDTDWYESTRHELDHLYDRLSPGGILIIDDLRYWEGSYRATQEWLDETGEPFFLVPMGPAGIAVKPFGSRDGVNSGS